jgi:hypothetical protein
MLSKNLNLILTTTVRASWHRGEHCQVAGTTLRKAIDRVTDSSNHVFLCEPNRYRWANDPPQNKPICPEESSGLIDRSAKKLDQCWEGIGWQTYRDVRQCHLA